jgi:hypothetical protein
MEVIEVTILLRDILRIANLDHGDPDAIKPLHSLPLPLGM